MEAEFSGLLTGQRFREVVTRFCEIRGCEAGILLESGGGFSRRCRLHSGIGCVVVNVRMTMCTGAEKISSDLYSCMAMYR